VAVVRILVIVDDNIDVFRRDLASFGLIRSNC